MSLPLLGFGFAQGIASGTLNIVVLLGLWAEQVAGAVRPKAHVVSTYPVPPFGLFGCGGEFELSSDLLLDVTDQLGCSFTRQVFKAGNLKWSEQ